MALELLGLPFILPFFFVLAIVYGSLEVSGIFGNRGVKVIISLVIAFFSALTPFVSELVIFVIPYAAVFFIAFFFLGFVLSFFKGKGGKGEKDYSMLLVILALLLIFLSSGENFGIFSLEDENFVGMVVLLVIALVIFAGYKMGKDK